jgi:hypothetical protein
MLPKSVTEFSRSTSEMINVSVDMVRGLTWGETRGAACARKSCPRWPAA